MGSVGLLNYRDGFSTTATLSPSWEGLSYVELAPEWEKMTILTCPSMRASRRDAGGAGCMHEAQELWRKALPALMGRTTMGAEATEVPT